MGYSLNVFTGQLDNGGSAGGPFGAATWKTAVATEAALPTVGNADGDARVTLDSDYIWVWDATTSRWINVGIKAGDAGAAPNSAGYSLEYVDVAGNRREYRLTLQPADDSNPGIVSTDAQTFAGSKTFEDVTVTGALTLPSVLPSGVLTVDGGGEVVSTLLEDGELLIGSSGADPVASTLTGTPDQVIVTNGAGSITLELPQDIASTSSPTFTDLTTTGTHYADGGLDIHGTPGTDTLAIGTTNADIINIGRSGITINLVGSTINQTVTNLNVTDKNITLNSGGGVGSGSTVGIDVEENAVVTGYAQTSGDRLSWTLKAPASAGIITLTPGATGFTLNGSEVKGPASATDNALTRFDGVTGKLVQNSGVILSDGDSLSGIADLDTTGDVTVGNDLVVTGDTTIDTALTGVVKATAGLLSVSPVDLTTEVTGILPPDNGGTGQDFSAATGLIKAAAGTFSAAALVDADVDAAAAIARSKLANGTANHVVINSAGGAFASEAQLALSRGGTAVDNTTIAQNAVFAGPGSGGAGAAAFRALVAADVPSLAGTYLVRSAGDLDEGTFAGLANNTANQNITGLAFSTSTVRSFKAQVSVAIDATADLFAHFELMGINRAGTFSVSTDYSGDDIPGVSFDVNAGQVRISVGNVTGFATGDIRYRALTTSI